MNVQVSKIEDFSSGVYIIWLIGLIKNIYIPTYNYVENPETLNQKVRKKKIYIYIYIYINIYKQKYILM